MIIDPGQDAAGGIAEIVAEHRLKPVAVLLTHGHIDHVWSVAPVCGARGHPGVHPPGRPGAALRPGPGPAAGRGPAAVRGPGVHRAGRRQGTGRRDGAEPGRPGDHGQPGARAHPGVGGVPLRPGRSCSPATCCSPGRSGGPTCPAATTAAMMDSLARVCLTLPDETAGAARPRPADHHRRRAGQQSVPGRPGAGHRTGHAARLAGTGHRVYERETGGNDPNARGGHAARRAGRPDGDTGGLGGPPPGPRRGHLHRPARRQRGRPGRVPGRRRGRSRARAAGRVLREGHRPGSAAGRRATRTPSCPPARSRWPRTSWRCSASRTRCPSPSTGPAT